MKKLIMTKGLPASGKSTWAKEYITKDPSTVRINKDDLRAMLHNSVHSKGKEKFIIATRDMLITKALLEGNHVIVDDTNLNPIHEAKLRELAKTHNAEFIVEDFTHVPLAECIKRDKTRNNSVGEKVIRTMHNQYLKEEIPLIRYDGGLPDCYIFDIDGTLAIKGDRSPYDWSKVGEDSPNWPVIQTAQRLGSLLHSHIFIFSGRDSICKEQTLKWLNEHGVIYANLYMRDEGDMTKDAVIKEEFYNKYIKGQYNVLGIFDDRNQVVSKWRSLGLPCYQVQEGDF